MILGDVVSVRLLGSYLGGRDAKLVRFLAQIEHALRKIFRFVNS